MTLAQSFKKACKRKGSDSIIVQSLIVLYIFLMVIMALLQLFMTFVFSLKTTQELHVDEFWTFPKTPMFSNYS